MQHLTERHVTKKIYGEEIKIYLKLNLKIIGDSPRTYPHISTSRGFPWVYHTNLCQKKSIIGKLFKMLVI